VGTDEAFLDVTATVNQRLCNEYIPAHPVLLDHLDSDGDSTAILHDFKVHWPKVNCVIDSTDETAKKNDDDDARLLRKRSHGNDGDDDDTILTDGMDGLDADAYRDPTSWFDIQLSIAAEIAATIRKQVYDELHYTCSAGKKEGGKRT
jgi:DNA polymerase eta